MPLIVIMWVTIFAQSTVMGWLGRPSTATRAPWLRLSIISGRAPADPLISRPMSKPSVMPRRSWADAIRSVETLVARSTPVFLASSSRASFTSVTTTKRAPTWRATAAAMSPIGPAPVTSTSSPTSGNDSAVCTALPNGSKIAARSGFMSAGCRHTSLAVAAVSADHMPLTGDHVTDSDRVHLGAYLHDVADELVSRNQGSVDGADGPAVPGLDVQIGAADARAGDANLDVVGACGRFGTFGQRDPVPQLPCREPSSGRLHLGQRSLLNCSLSLPLRDASLLQRRLAVEVPGAAQEHEPDRGHEQSRSRVGGLGQCHDHEDEEDQDDVRHEP